jgi:predicted RNase H-like nuclease (RuvC/YqgF family)
MVHKAEINEKITRKTEHEVARLKIRIEEKDKYIEQLKQDLDRVFNELKKYKKDGDNTGLHSSASAALIPKVPVE